MAQQTLDQQRAAFAWEVAKRAQKELPKFDDFKNLAKGAPALIMGNGLMPTLAFYASRKDGKHAGLLNEAIRGWLNTRFATHPELGSSKPASYAELMDRLVKAPSAFYMQATDETLSMLRWLRQFASAIEK